MLGISDWTAQRKELKTPLFRWFRLTHSRPHHKRANKTKALKLKLRPLPPRARHGALLSSEKRVPWQKVVHLVPHGRRLVPRVVLVQKVGNVPEDRRPGPGRLGRRPQLGRHAGGRAAGALVPPGLPAHLADLGGKLMEDVGDAGVHEGVHVLSVDKRQAGQLVYAGKKITARRRFRSNGFSPLFPVIGLTTKRVPNLSRKQLC